MSLRAASAPGCADFGSTARTLACFVEPAPLLAGSREHLAHRFPEPERAVPDGQDRGGQAAAAAIAQHIGPRLGRFPEPIGQGDELLAAISTHADHHQQAELLLLETDLEMNAVDPQVGVATDRAARRPWPRLATARSAG
jgi:hypothetical protein